MEFRGDYQRQGADWRVVKFGRTSRVVHRVGKIIGREIASHAAQKAAKLTKMVKLVKEVHEAMKHRDEDNL